jgi:peptidoglycan/LPS O-acetylase OafA/YrhL
MAKRYYRPELDALRFFAFAGVFCSHLPIKNHWLKPIATMGAYGMCMFFMLSAYLIITILLRERESTGAVSLSRFATRRVLRIWPLYFLVLFGDYFLGLHWLKSLHMSGHALLAFSFLLGNLYIIRHGFMGPVNPLWSLSVEEQFYLAVPAIIRFGGRRAIILISIVTISLAYVVLLRLGPHVALGRYIWINSFVQFQFFAAGALAALWLHDRDLTLSLKLRAVIWMIGLASWLGAERLFYFKNQPQAALVAAFLFMLLGTCLIFFSVIDIKLRIPQTFIYLGKISYGLYVFHAFFLWMLFGTGAHWPSMMYFNRHKLIAVLLAFGLTVATAAISYHFFERPILKFKERFETIHTRPA